MTFDRYERRPRRGGAGLRATWGAGLPATGGNGIPRDGRGQRLEPSRRKRDGRSTRVTVEVLDTVRDTRAAFRQRRTAFQHAEPRRGRKGLPIVETTGRAGRDERAPRTSGSLETPWYVGEPPSRVRTTRNGRRARFVVVRGSFRTLAAGCPAPYARSPVIERRAEGACRRRRSPLAFRNVEHAFDTRRGPTVSAVHAGGGLPLSTNSRSRSKPRSSPSVHRRAAIHDR